MSLPNWQTGSTLGISVWVDDGSHLFPLRDNLDVLYQSGKFIGSCSVRMELPIFWTCFFNVLDYSVCFSVLNKSVMSPILFTRNIINANACIFLFQVNLHLFFCIPWQAARNNILLAVPALLYAINNYLKFIMQVYVLFVVYMFHCSLTRELWRWSIYMIPWIALLFCSLIVKF